MGDKQRLFKIWKTLVLYRDLILLADRSLHNACNNGSKRQNCILPLSFV